MPFIAIAAIIVLTLGGGVTAAADGAKPGDALYSYKTTINDNVRYEYHALKASLNLEANAHADASADTHLSGQDVGNSDDGAAGGPKSGLMIRTDGDASSTPANVNADGSVHVNIY